MRLITYLCGFRASVFCCAYEGADHLLFVWCYHWLDGSVVRALDFNIQGCGFKPPPNYFLEHNEGPSIISTFDAATENRTHDPWLAIVALRPLGYAVLWQRRRTMTYLPNVTMPTSMTSAMVIVPCSITTWWQMASRTSCFVETLSITPVFTLLNLWGLLVPEKGRNPGFHPKMSLHGRCKKWCFSNKQASGNYVK